MAEVTLIRRNRDPPPDDPDDDCDIEGLGPPLSRGRSRYGWDSERNCPYLIEADEVGYED